MHLKHKGDKGGARRATPKCADKAPSGKVFAVLHCADQRAREDINDRPNQEQAGTVIDKYFNAFNLIECLEL